MADNKGTWRAEVLTFGETHWAGNALRFDTEAEALEYAVNLRARWTLVDKIRAVPVTTPERELYVVDPELAARRARVLARAEAMLFPGKAPGTLLRPDADQLVPGSVVYRCPECGRTWTTDDDPSEFSAGHDCEV
jgi:rubrerythrin